MAAGNYITPFSFPGLKKKNNKKNLNYSFRGIFVAVRSLFTYTECYLLRSLPISPWPKRTNQPTQNTRFYCEPK